jgi:hypothetical protein
LSLSSEIYRITFLSQGELRLRAAWELTDGTPKRPLKNLKKKILGCGCLSRLSMSLIWKKKTEQGARYINKEREMKRKRVTKDRIAYGNLLTKFEGGLSQVRNSDVHELLKKL